MRSALAISLLTLAIIAVPVGAQPPVRRATTIEAIRAYPVFFHGQAVAVLGTVTRTETTATLTDETGTIRLVGTDAPGEGRYEVRGVVYDIGRMNRDDPRLVPLDIGGALTRAYGDTWPRPGEELVLHVSISAPPPDTASATAPRVRNVALDPLRYADQTVTLVGQFRGRNLYADLPEAPTNERWDFVVRAGDGAVWVTGLRPRGDDFSFDPSRRVDTGRWIRVAGAMHYGGGLVWMDGTSIALADAPDEEVAPPVIAAPPPPPLDVLFSAPTADEVEVGTARTIRVQFSRDVDPASLEGRITVEASLAGQEAAPASIALTFDYTPATRGLEIVPAEPLPPFHVITVKLLDGIEGPDGSRLEPFTLRFTTGGPGPQMTQAADDGRR